MLTTFEFASIEIFDCDYELYDEGVNPGQLHEITYTRNYYIAMLLLYCEVTKKYRTEKLTEKLKYAGSSKDNSGWEYKNVLSGLRNIVKADFMTIMPDYASDFENARNTVAESLDSRIVKREEKRFEDMKKNVNYEKVRNALSVRKQQFLDEFDNFAEKTSDYTQLRPIRTEFEVSYREIEKDTSLRVFHSDYYPLFQGILLTQYMNSKSFTEKWVATLLDIPCADGEILLMTHKLYAKLYHIKGIQFAGNSLIYYENKDFTIEYIRSNFDGIILKSDFTKAFSRPELNDSASRIATQESTSDISFITHVDVIFSQNMNIEFPAYCVTELEEVKLENITVGGKSL